MGLANPDLKVGVWGEHPRPLWAGFAASHFMLLISMSLKWTSAPSD
jgi:hypothetical protein